MDDHALSISLSDKRLAQGLFLALKSFSNVRGDTVPLRLVIAFLAIAIDEGRCANEYAKALDVHRYVMSRYVHELADQDRSGGAGLGLVRIVPERTRLNNRQNILLTAKGRAIAHELLRNLRPTQTSEAA
jgi:hypothetical protein